MRPLSRRDLIRRFRSLGFDGPFIGGRHPFMKKGKLKVHIPGEHRGDVSIPLQREILKQAGISINDWEQV